MRNWAALSYLIGLVETNKAKQAQEQITNTKGLYVTSAGTFAQKKPRVRGIVRQRDTSIPWQALQALRQACEVKEAVAKNEELPERYKRYLRRQARIAKEDSNDTR